MNAITLKNKSPEQLRLATSVFFFISGFGYSTWASRIPSIQQHLHLNEAQLGAVLFAMPIGLILTLPFTSKLLGHFESRIIMLIGALIFNVLLSLPGFVVSTLQLVLVLFCFGSARNLMNLSANTQAVYVQALYTRSILTTMHGIWSLAGFAGAGLGYLMVLFNVRTGWHLLSVSIVLVISALLCFPYTLEKKPELQAKKPVFSLPDKQMMKFALICFGCMACENIMYDWSGIYFLKVVHSSKAASIGAYVVYMVTMTIGRFGGDKLVGIIGVKKLLTYSGWLIFSGLMIAVLLPYPITAVFGFAMVGLGVSCIVPLVFSIAGKIKNVNTGQSLAAVSTIGYLGFLLVPPMVGFIAQATNLRWSFAVIAFMSTVIIFNVAAIPAAEETEKEMVQVEEV
ncbi:MAG TPA: MFS transporter [Chitinophagaceae bacterium]|jgi:MFS family permease|nr:MFS transporter [Chitinophagaceae bacterium]